MCHVCVCFMDVSVWNKTWLIDWLNNLNMPVFKTSFLFEKAFDRCFARFSYEIVLCFYHFARAYNGAPSRGSVGAERHSLFRRSKEDEIWLIVKHFSVVLKLVRQTERFFKFFSIGILTMYAILWQNYYSVFGGPAIMSLMSGQRSPTWVLRQDGTRRTMLWWCHAIAIEWTTSATINLTQS